MNTNVLCRHLIKASCGKNIQIVSSVQGVKTLRPISYSSHNLCKWNTKTVPSQKAHILQCASDSRLLSTAAFDTSTLLGKLKKMMPGSTRMKYKKKVLHRSALRLYLCCVELVDYDQFFVEFNLPDTFNSWFRITELHLWMCLNRLASEGKEGEYLLNNVTMRLWEDVNKRARKLGGSAVSVRKEGINTLGEQFKFTLYAYDEGLLDHDRVLAGQLWRIFFDYDCHNAEQLEMLVHYVHKQVRHLEEQDSAKIMSSGLMTFLPLKGHAEDTQRSKHILKEIYNRI